MLSEQRKYFKTCYQNKDDMLSEQRKYFKTCYQNKESVLIHVIRTKIIF